MADQVAARVALVAGATGLVGREVLAALLADKTYSAIHCVGRRAPPISHPKLTCHTVDFGALPVLPHTDDVYIALGTTIKIAGSQAAFRAVDYEAVVAVAQAARSSGATRLGVVSAMGASARSAVFYNRVKGEME
ncbi:MAG: NAD(P)H-binding protein, partial [Rhodoferax sp.]